MPPYHTTGQQAGKRYSAGRTQAAISAPGRTPVAPRTRRRL